MTTTRRLAAILAADVAGYSAAMERDEEGTAAAVRALRRKVIEPKLDEHHGRLIKTTGDGFLVEFASPIAALKCALAIQQRPDEGSGLRLRIGLNLGDVIIEEGGDLLGDGVNIAARLESLAEPGGILISSKIHSEVDGKVEATFEDRGEQQVKNIQRPVRVYSVTAGLPTATMRAALESSKPLPLPDKPSIAVLPFQNMSGDPEQEYFADGIVEDIITALSRFKSLFVIARNSTFTYKGKAVDIKKVGRELGVRYVLEGSVRKSSGRVRITGQLIEAETGHHLWADRFDGALDDIFDLQDQVTARVVRAVAPSVERAEIDRSAVKSTGHLDAYDCYLRGRAALQSTSIGGNKAALAYFRKAIDLDAAFGRAYAWSAYCIQLRRLQSWSSWTIDWEGEIAEGTLFAEQAVANGQNDAEALAYAAFFFALVKHEVELADRIIDQAISLNPNTAHAQYIRGWISVWMGRPEAAIAQLETAIRLSPADSNIVGAYSAMGSACNYSGRPDEALVWIGKALARSPNSIPALLNAIVATVALRKLDSARNYAERYIKIVPDLNISRVRDVVAFQRPQDLDLLFNALRTVGIPE